MFALSFSRSWRYHLLQVESDKLYLKM